MAPPRSSPARLLYSRENKLFARWLVRSPTLLRDGALGGPESTYLQQRVRVLFLLKEANDSGARWSSRGADLRQHAADFATLRSTFPVLLLLASLAQSVTPAGNIPQTFEQTQSLLRDPAARVQLLQSIVLVNLKKTPGGPMCQDKTLVSALSHEGDLLREQLLLYRPHLTITGGHSVFTLLAQLLAANASTSPGPRPFFHHPALGLCLSFFHPQATKGYRALHDLLRDTLRAHHFRPPTIDPA